MNLDQKTSGVQLTSFIYQLIVDLYGFGKYWMEKHQENPEDYPLTVNVDNTGLWMEQFLIFLEMKQLALKQAKGDHEKL